MLESMKKLTKISSRTIRGISHICTVEVSDGSIDEWTRRKLVSAMYDSAKVLLAEAFERGFVPKKLEELVQSNDFDDYLSFISSGIYDYDYFSVEFTDGYESKNGTFLLDSAELSILLIEENAERIPTLPNEKLKCDVEVELVLRYKKFDKNSDAYVTMRTRAPSFRWWEKNRIRDMY